MRFVIYNYYSVAYLHFNWTCDKTDLFLLIKAILFAYQSVSIYILIMYKLAGRKIQSQPKNKHYIIASRLLINPL